MGISSRGSTSVDIAFTVDAMEYKDATEMAKSRGFNNIEDLMNKKFDHAMSIYYTNKENQEEVANGSNMEEISIRR